MAQTVVDLGKAVKAKYPGAYDQMDDAELGRAVKQKYPGAYDAYTESAANATNAAPAAPKSFAQGAIDTGLNVLSGIGAGALSTLYHGGDLIRRATGQERIINNPEVQALITPRTGAEKLGFMTEQGLEFFAPSNLAGKVEKAVQAYNAGRRGASLLNLATRVGLESASGAGIAGLQTGGDPQAMQEAARNSAIVTGALGAGQIVAPWLVPWLKQAALDQYGRVLNPTKQGTKFLAKTEVAPGLVERGVVAGTVKGLQNRAAQEVQKYGQAIGDAWANVPPGTVLDEAAIVKGIDDAAKQYMITTSAGNVNKGPIANIALRNLNRLKQTMIDVAEVNPTTGVREIPVDRVHELKQFFDDIAAEAGMYEGKNLRDTAIGKAHGIVAGVARDELAQQFPDIARINKEYSFWKDVQEVVDATAMRRTGQAKPLGRKLAGAAGAAAGFATGGTPGLLLGKEAADMWERISTGVGWGTVNAVMKDRLANAMAAGNKPEVEFWLRKIANSIGGVKATSESLQRAGPATVTP